MCFFFWWRFQLSGKATILTPSIKQNVSHGAMVFRCGDEHGDGRRQKLEKLAAGNMADHLQTITGHPLKKTVSRTRYPTATLAAPAAQGSPA